jgi:hypothetical protein
MIQKLISKLNLQRPEECLVLGQGKSLNFRVTTDGAFGGQSKAAFENSRVFRGTLVGELPFAAMRAVLPAESQDIGDFRGVTLRVRSKDKRNFALNLQTPTFFAHDLYQGFIVLPRENEFFELSLPFNHFLLTGKGKIREIQRELDTNTITTLGFSVGGHGSRPGDFELEIDWIKWVRDL